MKIGVYIVPTCRESDPEPERLDRMRKMLLHFAGGFSEHMGKGAWKDPYGVAVYELHLRFEVWSDSETLAQITRCFCDILRSAGEKAAAFVVDGVPQIVTL